MSGVQDHYKENFFNLNKTDYAYSPLFLGQPMGLIDTISKPNIEFEQYAQRLKALDWSETEFSLKSCKQDFKSADKNAVDVMLYTLATQWEADTTAALHVVPVLAPVVTSTELWTYYVEEMRNEMLHARIYANIVRESFDDPEEGRREILKRQEALRRLQPVTDVFTQTDVMTAKYKLRMIDNNQDLYNQVFKFIVAKYLMEALQFVSSFGATYCLGYDGGFNPAVRNVEKINQDEFEIHAPVGALIIKKEMATQKGQTAYMQCRQWIETFARQVVQGELGWNQFMNEGGRYIPNATKNQMDQLVFWNAAPVFKTLGLPLSFDVPKRFPLPLIEKSFNISKTQGSPQEEKTGMYMVGEVVDDIDPDKNIFIQSTLVFED